jgi:acyl-CoA synthetase (AMP-forming)/AMP-acid ligase II
VPDERLGEEICAWVKVLPNSKLTEAGLKEFCKQKISAFKIPKYIKFVESFPTNASNKVLKTVMQKEAIAQLGLKQN